MRSDTQPKNGRHTPFSTRSIVSANPTGPLTLGHGRQAVLGDCVARLFRAAGYDVVREYYFNNAGRQMRVLGESVRARYLELCGRLSTFPEDGYQGDYIREIAQRLRDAHGDRLAGEGHDALFRGAAEESIFADIRRTLERLGIRFDVYSNEASLYTEGKVEETLATLRERGLVYEKDGATWLAYSTIGRPQDRVLVKSSGEPTYRLPDIAYHREKLRRGFDLVLNVQGADHIEEAKDVVAAIAALQFGLGVATLLLVVPTWLGTLHQAAAFLLLGAAVIARHQLATPEAALSVPAPSGIARERAL